MERPDLDGDLELTFAPLHKRALGMAFGVAVGLLIAGATAAHLVVQPDPGPPLYLLSEYLTGYTVSWGGALIGAAWGFVAGFAAGWFLAFTRNLALATFIFITRTKADLTASRDFLDHI